MTSRRSYTQDIGSSSNRVRAVYSGFPGLGPGDRVRVGEFEMTVTNITLEQITPDVLEVTTFGSNERQFVAGKGGGQARFLIEGVDLVRSTPDEPVGPRDRKRGDKSQAKDGGVGPRVEPRGRAIIQWGEDV